MLLLLGQLGHLLEDAGRDVLSPSLAGAFTSFQLRVLLDHVLPELVLPPHKILAVADDLFRAQPSVSSQGHKAEMHIVWGTLLYSLMYFIPIFLSVYFGTDLVQKIVAFIPAWLTDGLNLGSKFLTAYGIALLLSTMLNRDLTVYFLLGFFFVGYLGLDITAVAIFAAILAVILTGLKYGKGAPVAAAAGAAAANPDYDPLEDDDDL